VVKLAEKKTRTGNFADKVVVLCYVQRRALMVLF